MPLKFLRELKAQAIPCSLSFVEGCEDGANAEFVSFCRSSPTSQIFAYVGVWEDGRQFIEDLCIASSESPDDRFVSTELSAKGLIHCFNEGNETQEDSAVVDYVSREEELPGSRPSSVQQTRSGSNSVYNTPPPYLSVRTNSADQR